MLTVKTGTTVSESLPPGWAIATDQASVIGIVSAAGKTTLTAKSPGSAHLTIETPDGTSLRFGVMVTT